MDKSITFCATLKTISTPYQNLILLKDVYFMILSILHAVQIYGGKSETTLALSANTHSNVLPLPNSDAVRVKTGGPARKKRAKEKKREKNKDKDGGRR